MVAVVSGSGLGLFNTSANILGGGGAQGNPSLARGPDRVFVNSATGNLIVQSVDERLAATGLDLSLVRTYNSQGHLDDDNGDNWRLGVHLRLQGLTGTINNAGSTITKIFGDGAAVLYTYDASQSRYVSQDGDGAHDTLAYNSGTSTWTWTDGSARNTETYDAAGRLTQSRDADGNLVSYHYTGNLLTRIVDASGQETFLDYTGNNLAAIRVVSGGSTQTLTHYTYDSFDRLQSVRVDLSPGDNSISDANVYLTTYGYEGTSNRIASVTHEDGTQVAFTYEQVGSRYRVKTYTEGGTASGTSRTTTLTYTGGTGGGTGTVNANTSVLTTTETVVTPVPVPPYYTLRAGDTWASIAERLYGDAGLGGALSAALGNPTLVPNQQFTGIPEVLIDSQTSVVHVRGSQSVSSAPVANTYLDDAGRLIGTRHTDGTLTSFAYNTAGRLVEWTKFAEPPATLEWYQNFSADTSGLTIEGPAGISRQNGSLVFDQTSATGEPWMSATGTRLHAEEDLVAYRGEISTGPSSTGRHFMFGTYSSSAQAYLGVVVKGSDLETYWFDNVTAPNTASLGTLEANATYVVEVVVGGGTGESTVYVYRKGTSRSEGWSFHRDFAQWGDSQLLIDAEPNGSGATTRIDNVSEHSHLGEVMDQWVASSTAGDAYTSYYDPNTQVYESLGAATDSYRRYTVTVPEGAKQLRISTAGLNGDADLYLRYGVAASRDAFDHLSGGGTSNELIVVDNPAAGTWHIAVHAWVEFDDLDLTVEYDTLRPLGPYVMENGDTWASIAENLYGNASLADELAAALGNPALVQPHRLTNLPSTLVLNVLATSGYVLNQGAIGPTPPVESYYEDGRLTGVRALDGTFITFQYDEAGNLRSYRTHAEEPVPAIWYQDFTTDASGLTTMPPGFSTLENGGLTVVTRGDIGHSWATAYGERVHNYDDHLVYRGELTMGDTHSGRKMSLGAVNTSGTRGLAAYFLENRVYASHNNGQWVDVDLGMVKDGTTYVVELVTHSQGATLHVYDKGTSRDNGYRYDFEVGDWGDSRLFLDSYTDFDHPITNVRFDNLSESTHLGPLVGSFIVREDPQDLVQTLPTSTTNVLHPNQSAATGQTLQYTVTVPVGTTELRIRTSADNGDADLYLRYGEQVDPDFHDYVSGGATSNEELIIRTPTPGVWYISVNAWEAFAGLDLEIGFDVLDSAGQTYTVQAGDTWSSIALALYQNAGVANELQAALGSPALSAGFVLSNLPQLLYDAQRITSVTRALNEEEVIDTEEQEVEVPVTPYYTVQAGDTWSSIAQLIYGTSAPDVVAALQAQLGNPTLTAGAHLLVPLTLTAGGQAGLASQLDIQSPLGLVTTLTNDASGRLVSVQSPSVGGVRLATEYEYDGDGNVRRVTTDANGTARETFFDYDERGNLELTRDAAGNTVSRTYNAANQVLTETVYVTPDLDGDGAGVPSGAVTTRYVYGTGDRLRFTISADGRVTEKQYYANGLLRATLRYTDSAYSLSGLASNQIPTESQVATWAAARNLARLERVDYAYDFRGNLTTATAFTQTDSSGVGISSTASVTRYVYDQRGQLLKSFDARGEATSDPNDYSTTYTYDGLGRLLSTVEWISGTSARPTVTQYDDALNRTITTYVNGLVTISTFNRAGQLISVANTGPSSTALGTTTHVYDSAGRLRYTADPLGQRQYMLYDAAGRKVGTVDADGTLTEHAYNGASQLIKTIVYGDRLSDVTLTQLAGSTALTVADLRGSLATVQGRDPSRDRITRSVYDAAGQLVYAIDEEGNVAHSVYDGAGRISSLAQYAVPISVAREVDELSVSSVATAITPDATNDRRSRYFYDGSGNRTGVLDGEGYLSEYVYDAAGRLVEEVKWSDDTDPGQRVAGSLTDLHNSVTQDATKDIRVRYFYDGQGRQIGALDGQGYLTESTYHVSGQLWQTLRYDRPLTYAATSDPFQTLKDAANAAPAVVIHTTTHLYDGAGRLISQTNFEGTLTGTRYDDVRGTVAVTSAQGTDQARSSQLRYDALGRVVAELSAKGASLLAEGMSDASVNAIWTQHAVHYAYDLAGRRISATDQNNLRTLYYYDADGRQRYSINAYGEVTESRYNGLGQLSELVKYAGRIPSPTSLAPGAALETVASAVAAIRNDDKDSHTQYTYTLTGRVRTTATAEGTSLTFDYNAFGQEESRIQVVDAARSLESRTTYDRRGLLDTVRWDPNGLNLQESREYDAFGRLERTVDLNGNVRRLGYDRLGRVIDSYDPSSPLTSPVHTTYDAFDRVLVLRDRLGNETEYEYDDVARSVIVTTPEGIRFTSIQNRHGDVVRMEKPNGHITVTEYDDNGNITLVSDNLTSANAGVIDIRDYDDAGRLVSVTDSRNVVTTIQYDPANRVFRRIVDSAAGSGLARVTQYMYDGAGRTLDVTDENGIVTHTEYDKDGRVQQVTVDPGATPAHLNIVTRYQYDAADNIVRVTEGYGTDRPRVVEYGYDVLGRRTREVVDPGVGINPVLGVPYLNLETTYQYDGNGNVVVRKDAAGNYTRYVYDAEDRLRFTVDALNGVTEKRYDVVGNVTETIRYATAVTAGSITADPSQRITLAAITAPGVLVTNADTDRIERTFYDRDGRAVFELNAARGLTRKTYDGNGNVTQTMVFALAVPSNVPLTYSDLATWSGQRVNDEDNRYTRTAYDLRDQPTFTLDASNALVRSYYDAIGNLVAQTAYAKQLDVGVDAVVLANLTDANLRAWSENAANQGTADRTTRFYYDGAGRAIFQIDAEGYVTQTLYDDAQRTTTTISYYTKPTTLGSAPTLQQVRAAVGALGFPNASTDRAETRKYDAAGRLERVTDANGNFESYEYDAVGNKTAFVNKRGSRWTYEYDANRRLKEEHAPIVNVTNVTPNGTGLQAAEDLGTLLVTHMTYDALGNVKTRTEAFGVVDSLGRDLSRTTTYVYDELGRQIKTILPEASYYSGSIESDALVTGSSVSRVEQSLQLETETRYNALGDAVWSRDVNGKYTHKVYDKLGRVTHDVDALRQVSVYGYDTFGNRTSVLRYAAPLSGAALDSTPLTALDIHIRLIPGPLDRQISTTYDRLNRAFQVVQAEVLVYEPGLTPGQRGTSTQARAITSNYYNAFGDLARQEQLLTASPQTWAKTYFYYDHLGRQTEIVDAGGFLTHLRYDAEGNLVRRVEYAEALAAGTWSEASPGTPTPRTPQVNAANAKGYDRETWFEYDRLNRKISETLINFEYDTETTVGSGDSHAVGSRTTTFGYDVVGNQTRVTVNGASTYTYYDVLGRVIAVAEPLRNTGSQTLVPFTEMKRDAYGNLVVQKQYARGVSSAGETANPPTPLTHADDRITYIEVDRFGRAIQTQDANGANRFASYTRRGDVAKEWQIVTNPNDGSVDAVITIYRYDDLGRQIEVIEPKSSATVPGTLEGTMRTKSVYNAFGEITSKTSELRNTSGALVAGNANGTEYFDYDNAGRVWRTNSGDGVDKVYLYNLLGKATVEIRSRGTTDLQTYGSAAAVDSLTIETARTETLYDALGRVVEQRQATFVGSAGPLPIIANFVIGDFAGPSNPRAYYRRPFNDPYGASGQTDWQVDADATVAEWGQYYFDSALGQWRQDTSSTWVTRRFIHWNAPEDVSLIKRFWLTSDNGATWTQREVYALWNGELGVNVADLGIGNYRYRIEYLRTGDTQPLFQASGDVQITGNYDISMTVSQDPGPETVNNVALSGHTLTWTTNTSTTSRFLTRLSGTEQWGYWTFDPVDSGGVRTYSVDVGEIIQGGTYQWRVENIRNGVVVAAKEGSFHTTGEATIRDPVPTLHPHPNPVVGNVTATATGNDFTLTWAAPPSLGVPGGDQGYQPTLQLVKRDTGATWNFTPQIINPGSSNIQFAVLVQGFQNGTYDYTITYTRIGTTQTTRATGAVTFTAAAGSTNVNVSVSPNAAQSLPEMPATVQAMTIPTTGGTATLVSSTSVETYFDFIVLDYRRRFVGSNQVNVSWTSVGSTPIRVEMVYTNYGGFADEKTRSITLPSGENGGPFTIFTWPETDDPNGFFYEYGIREVRKIRVYTLSGTLLQEFAPTQRYGFQWAPPGGSYFEEAGYRLLGTTSWNQVAIGSQGSNRAIDMTPDIFSNPGSYEYFVRYRQSPSSAYTEVLGRFDMVAGASGRYVTNVTRDSAQTYTPTYLTSANVTQVGTQIRWTGPTPPGYEVQFVYSLNGGAEQTIINPPTNGPNNYYVDLALLGQGNYTYTIRHRSNNNQLHAAYGTGTATYTVTNTSTPASITPVAATPTSQITYISSISANGDTLSWTHPPLPNSTVKLRYRHAGDWIEVPMSGNGPTYSYFFWDTPIGDIYYEIVYSQNGQTYAYALGRIDMMVLYHFEPGVITNFTQDHAFPTVPGVSNLQDIGNGTLYWSDPATQGSNVYVRYRTIGGSYSDPLPATPSGASGYFFDFTNYMALGTSAFEYEITYAFPGQNPYRRSSGRLDYTKNLNVTPHLQDTTVQTEFTQARTPRIRQKLDRWGNAIEVEDTANQIATYRYNQLDQVVESLLPNVAIYNYTAAVPPGQLGQPRSTNYYDVNGRLIATRDANRNLSRVLLNDAGQVLQEFHADGGQKRYGYDAFGQIVQTENERGFLTRNTFDRVGNLTATEAERVIDGFDQNSWMPNATIRHAFGYDAAGRRVWETTGETMIGGADETYRYYYDLQGNVRRRVTPVGFETVYGYDIHGNKVSEINAIGDSMSWSYDAFGRLKAHIDLTEVARGATPGKAGASYTYLHNEAGQLYRQYNNEGQRVDYIYDGAGHLKTITEQTSSESAAVQEANNAGLAVLDRITSFEYDAAGRRSREKTVIDDVVHQDTRIGYDTAGRVNRLSDLRYQVTYGYDANGNRTHILATYYDHQQVARQQNLYYTYDGMNRVRISQGALVNGTVDVTTTQGTLLEYYLTGERWTALSYGIRFNEQSGGYYREEGMTLEEYEYDGLGRLTTVRKDDVLTQSYDYDRASREIYEQSNNIEGNLGLGTLKTSTRVTSYDDDGRISEQTTYRAGNTNLANRESRVQYGTSTYGSGWSRGYDSAGNLRSYLVTVFDTNGTSEIYRTTYSFEYRAGEAYQEASQTASTNNPGAGRPETGQTTRTYNVAGELVAFADLRASGLERNRYFANSASGQPLTVVQGAYGDARSSSALSALEQAVNGLSNGPRAQHFFFANGQATGSFGQLREKGVFDANFDVNYTPISSDYPASAPATVVAQNGDTLRLIAARIFGDANLWFVLAEENGLTDPDAVLQAGTLIRVPNEVISLSNSSAVFKPFDASESLGDTTPTQPIAPARKNKGCGVLGQIIVIIVVIVVAYYTGLYLGGLASAGGAGAGAAGAGAGAGAGAAGAGAAGAGAAGFSASSFAIGAISAGAGNIAGQLVGMALGVQDEFSWKAVGAAALTSGILKGTPLGSIGGDSISSLVAQGAVNNAVTQGVNIALGLQNGFSWRDVAIEAISAPVARQVEKSLGSDAFLSSAAGSLASAGVRVALGGKLELKSVLADAFGQALGNSIVTAVSAVGTAAENPVEDQPGNSDTGVEQIEEVVVTAQKRALGEGALVSNPSLAQTVPGATVSAEEVRAEAEIPEIVVSGTRSVGNQLDSLERLRLSDVRVIGKQAIARVNAYNRLIDHGIALGRTERVFSLAARQAWWNSADQDAFAQASSLMGDPELRQSVLTASGLTEEDLAGLDAGDAFEKISKGAYQNLNSTLQVAESARGAADGAYNTPVERRLLDLMANDFEGAGSRNFAGWLTSQSPAGSVFVMDELGAQLRNDVAAVNMAASVGLLPRHFVDAVAASANESMSNTLWDTASLGLKGKLAIAGEMLSQMPLIGDAQAGTKGIRGVTALNSALGSASRGMSRLQSAVSRAAPVKLSSREEYLAATLNRKPNTTYKFEGFEFTTDHLGRASVSQGRVKLDTGDNRFDYYDKRIGKSGKSGDIGFHLGGNQFGFPGGALNVVPGNAKLNSTVYYSLEADIKALAKANPGRVQGRFEAIYDRTNTSNRPDSFRVSITVSGKPNIDVTLPNKAPKSRRSG